MAFSAQCIYELSRPDTILYEEGLNAVQAVSRDAAIFINASEKKTLPFEKTDVIICSQKLDPFYTRYRPDAVIIDIEKTESYQINGWELEITDDEVYINGDNAYARLEKSEYDS